MSSSRTYSQHEELDEIVHYEVEKDGKLKCDNYEQLEAEWKYQTGEMYDSGIQPSIHSSDSYKHTREQSSFDKKTEDEQQYTASYSRMLQSDKTAGPYTTVESSMQYTTSTVPTTHYTTDTRAYVTTDTTAYSPYKPGTTYEESQQIPGRYVSTQAYGYDGGVEGHKITQITYQENQQGLQYRQIYNAAPDNLEAAIAVGRVYAPANSAYVSGDVIQRSGLSTPYDGHLIPTFETELEIKALPRLPPLPTESSRRGMTYDEKSAVNNESSSGFGISKRVNQARHRMQCC